MTKSNNPYKHMKLLLLVAIASAISLSPLLYSKTALAADPNILSIFAGTGNSGTPTPGPATSSDLGGSEGLAVDSLGNVYIADDGNYLIEKVTSSGTLSIFAGTGNSGTPTPGPA